MRFGNVNNFPLAKIFQCTKHIFHVNLQEFIKAYRDVEKCNVANTSCIVAESS